jgi:hypothetical protein
MQKFHVVVVGLWNANIRLLAAKEAKTLYLDFRPYLMRYLKRNLLHQKLIVRWRCLRSLALFHALRQRKFKVPLLGTHMTQSMMLNWLYSANSEISKIWLWTDAGFLSQL